ncbi:RNA polymerase sigma factor [Fodinibius saliphilus]|uniref:RNA polymerase sigma factor n=1 Tax=Fodinibius saliphilus TaxID=1920650 RepID=UPI001486A6D2|nr:RNA polymerase sigma factor [Fodinibius saliphilus]
MKNKEPKKDRFEQLYQHHSNKVYRICTGYLQDENKVKDLFQQVMLNIWNNLESFRGEAQITTWVYRITVNTAITFTKSEKRLNKRFRLEADFTDIEDDNHSSFSPDLLPRLQKLNDCIHQLDKQNRIIITLYLEGLSYSDIGKVVGISENYVGVKINRIKKELDQLMR